TPRAKPRLIVLGFVPGENNLVPSRFGDVIADQFASYCSNYEVIDRGEVCWYMGRLGITLDQLLADRLARRALAQALDGQFYVFGAIARSASMNVTAALVDSETGASTGQGRIHVQDTEELKLRVGELARQVGANPAEQKQMAQQGTRTEATLKEARTLLASK